MKIFDTYGQDRTIAVFFLPEELKYLVAVLHFKIHTEFLVLCMMKEVRKLKIRRKKADKSAMEFFYLNCGF